MPMDAETLKALQAPIKQKYRDAPDSAVITLKAEGTVGAEGVTCKVDTGPRPGRGRSAPRCWR